MISSQIQKLWSLHTFWGQCPERDHEKVIDFRRNSCRACAGQEDFHGIRLQSENSFHSFFSPPQLPKATFPRLGKGMEERYCMTHYLRYCCAMFFALFSFLLATPLNVHAQTREAMCHKARTRPPSPSTTMHCVPLAPARHGALGRQKKEGYIPRPLLGLEQARRKILLAARWCSMLRSETSVPPPPRSGFIVVKHSSRLRDWSVSIPQK